MTAHRHARRSQALSKPTRLDSYRRRQRMLWAEARRIPRALEHLVNDLRAELKAADVSFDAKPFLAHMTLVRHARRAWRDTTFSPVSMTFDAFELMASHTDLAGARYASRGRWDLARRRA